MNTTPPFLQINQLQHRFKSGRLFGLNFIQPSPVLTDINLTLESGKSLGIIGESGSGKSTLARLICGLEQPTQGQILLQGQPLPPPPPRSPSSRSACFPKQPCSHEPA